MIKELIGKEILISDGAMGTLLQQRGFRPGPVPETLNFTNAKDIEQIHREYFEAGSDFVATNTFGANRLKLKGSGYTVKEMIEQAAALAGNAAEKASCRHGRGMVALDLASTGEMLEPYGDLEYEEAVEIFAEQIAAGAEAGVDLILLETFMDLTELQAAIQAAREVCQLPVFASCSLQANGRTLMGTDIPTLVKVLEEAKVDALGLNCSLGPAQLLPLIQEVLRCTSLPVLVQPNAGLPELVDGAAVYNVTPEEFTAVMAQMLDAGVSIVGGCCGTTPEYIRSLRECIEKRGFLL